jgi:hypothetical protein
MASEGPFRGGAPRLIGDDHGVTSTRIGERFRRGKMTALPYTPLPQRERLLHRREGGRDQDLILLTYQEFSRLGWPVGQFLRFCSNLRPFR